MNCSMSLLHNLATFFPHFVKFTVFSQVIILEPPHPASENIDALRSAVQ